MSKFQVQVIGLTRSGEIVLTAARGLAVPVVGSEFTPAFAKPRPPTDEPSRVTPNAFGGDAAVLLRMLLKKTSYPTPKPPRNTVLSSPNNHGAKCGVYAKLKRGAKLLLSPFCFATVLKGLSNPANAGKGTTLKLVP